MIKRFQKDANSTLDFAVDWSAVIPDGDQITTSTFVVPAGLVVENEYIAEGRPVIWLSGGEINSVYEITNKIETTQGRIDERRFQVEVLDL